MIVASWLEYSGVLLLLLFISSKGGTTGILPIFMYIQRRGKIGYRRGVRCTYTVHYSTFTISIVVVILLRQSPSSNLLVLFSRVLLFTDELLSINSRTPNLS